MNDTSIFFKKGTIFFGLLFVSCASLAAYPICKGYQVKTFSTVGPCGLTGACLNGKTYQYHDIHDMFLNGELNPKGENTLVGKSSYSGNYYAQDGGGQYIQCLETPMHGSTAYTCDGKPSKNNNYDKSNNTYGVTDIFYCTPP
ncbi:MAG: hypothetical protein KBD83_03765 [Gammaproteobacteria bacterium]|nr:hypothetical protein [Gammaproteobacteria bacterium]